MKRSFIRDIDEKIFESAVKQAYSIREVCRNINVNQDGNQYQIVCLLIKERNLNTSHFDSYKNLRRNKGDEFSENSTYKRSNLRKRLRRENLIPHDNCAICNIERMWNGKPLVLHIDHINGVPNDNRLENLRFLCPNCHSQTDTYSGRNNKRQKLCMDCKTPILRPRKYCINCRAENG